MYSAHNKGKTAIAERFIRTSKNKIVKYMTSVSRFIRTSKYKIAKYMTSVSKDFCIVKLDDIVNKYNNTNYIRIKMRPVDVKSAHILNLVKKLVIKSRNLKLVILLKL